MEIVAERQVLVAQASTCGS